MSAGAQLELQLHPSWDWCPGHCSNCCTDRYEEHRAIMETLGDDHLARTAEWVSASFEERMDTSGLDEVRIRAERHHWEWRKALFLDELERRAAGGKVRRPERTLKERRADRVPCSNGCGARVHAGGSGLCYRCAVRAAREAA